MWNQKPLSSPGGSPKLGGQQQRSNPFASSRPLAGTAAAATATAPPPAGGHHRPGHQPPPQHPGANATTPATGPPPTAAYTPHVPAAGATAPPPTASPQRAFYPTPPEMHPQAGIGTGGVQMTGHETGGYGAMGPMAGGGVPQPSQQQARSYHQHHDRPHQHQHQQSQQQPTAYVPAPYPHAATGVQSASSPGLFVPRTADASLGPPPANSSSLVPPANMPPPFVPPTFGGTTPVSSGRSSPAGVAPPDGRSVGVGVVGTAGPPISLRGREKYCSGGAWVGPAPEWPKPPPDATIANADVSRVRPRHAPVVTTLREKFESLYAHASGARKKELDGISTKIGGMFVFLNEGTGETHISDNVADSLAALCAAMRAGDAATVNAHLLHVSTHHWEEAAYWFPSLKRLVKL